MIPVHFLDFSMDSSVGASPGRMEPVVQSLSLRLVIDRDFCTRPVSCLSVSKFLLTS